MSMNGFRLSQWHCDHVLLDEARFRLCAEARVSHAQVLYRVPVSRIQLLEKGEPPRSAAPAGKRDRQALV